MAQRNRDFQTIRSEGGLLPDDLLRRVLDPKAKLDGTRPEDYGLPKGERLNEVITQSWNRLRKHWAEFRVAAGNLPDGEAGTGLTNDKWSLPLLRELGFGVLTASAGPEVGGRSYAISRFFGPVPVHLVGCGLSLDRRAGGQRGAAVANPHGLVQEFLNRSEAHRWGMVANGLRLRILRDNQALSRQSFLEFDLEAMLDGESYSDFVILWLMAHATRLAPREGARPESCWLEQWTKEAEEQGIRALGDLRGGVERALQTLGEGLTSHLKNTALRDGLRTGQVSLAEFHGQLLRVIYRLIFLFVAEDRILDGQSLLHPKDESSAARIARERFAAHYSTARVRELAGRIKGSRHGDLWRQFQILIGALSGEVTFAAARDQLALPALGSLLWSPASTPALNDAELTNHDFLEVLRDLAFTRQGKLLRPVDYRNLGAEELGGVYESLLTLTPQISADGARFTFAGFAGNERKTSGSYYTPDSLVQCLLDSALDPVVEEAIRGKSGAEAEKAILTLKVCDPAVGSGHFLVGAAHRLARHLTRVRALAQGESEPSPLLYQRSLRDVIGRCLYGVDTNVMAAELCRVGLWLEALEPGKPLSFLDHHIRVGNSLLGATRELIAAGLPDDTFTAIQGDDKKACATLRRRNKAERKALGPLFADHDAEIQARLQHAAALLEELSDDHPEDIRVKELAFRRHEQTEEYRQKKLLADTWCAAFVVAKHLREVGREASASGITQRHLNDLAGGQALPAHLSAEVERLSEQYQFFHWHLAFPEVFAKGGFDCVLSNPPWERVKIQEQEWFAVHGREDIVNAPNTAARKRLIETLVMESPGLYGEFLDALRKAEGEGNLMRYSGRYPLCGRGDINLYAIFAEGMRSLLHAAGRLGCVLPTGIATDDTTKHFFQDLQKLNVLASLFDFINSEGLFPEVKRHQQFALITILGRGSSANAQEFAFFLAKVEELHDPERRFTLSAEDILLLNPNTRTCPIFRAKRDAELTEAIYRRVPVLIREATDDRAEENPWGIIFSRMFDMSTDSQLFRTWEELDKDGWRLDGSIFSRDGAEYLPLFDPKMAQQFNHRAADLSASGHQFRKISKERTSQEQLQDPSFSPTYLYWVPRASVEAASRANHKKWFIGFKDVSGTTSTNIGIFTVIPFCGVGHKFPILYSSAKASEIAMLVANLNSWIVEYVLRMKFNGLSLAYFFLKQLPILSPASYSARCAWAQGLESTSSWLLARVVELTYTAWDLEAFARDCGWFGPPFRWEDERRFLLRCELDAVFFHLYLSGERSGDWRRAEKEGVGELARLKDSFPTPRDAVAYMMDTFAIVRRKDEERCNGDYRTKRVILEIYDAIQESIGTGQPYKTRLDPPPADPRCCHPPHEKVKV